MYNLEDGDASITQITPAWQVTMDLALLTVLDPIIYDGLCGGCLRLTSRGSTSSSWVVDSAVDLPSNWSSHVGF